MAVFSKSSFDKLQTCHPDLQRLFQEVIKHYDCVVTEGYRGEEAQNAAFASGHSKLKYPNGKHNQKPSIAVDVVPYPVDYSDTNKIYHFAGFVIATAYQLKINIRWGGSWDGSMDLKANKFNDLVHFELLNP